MYAGKHTMSWKTSSPGQVPWRLVGPMSTVSTVQKLCSDLHSLNDKSDILPAGQLLPNPRR
jgi:hypothetical protein